MANIIKLLIFVSVCVLVLAHSFAPVLADEPEELKASEIKAGFIYHLTKLVTWPPDSFEKDDSPIFICFLGEDSEETADYFESQAHTFKAQGRALIVKRFEVPSTKADAKATARLLNDIKNSHVLFISENQERKLNRFPEIFDARGLLTVGETKDFAKSTGMVGLVTKNGKFKIYANVNNVERARLKISARFLQHAIIIKNGNTTNKRR